MSIYLNVSFIYPLNIWPLSVYQHNWASQFQLHVFILGNPVQAHEI